MAAAASSSSRRVLAPSAALLLLLVAAALAPRTAGAVLSCSTVYHTLMPCLEYVQSGGTVTPECCSGIQSLVATARTTPDRRAACTCIKKAFDGAAGGAYISRAAGLPGRCGVPVPFKISANMDCSIN